MKDVSHIDYRYSLTIRVDDLAVLHALRGLCQWAERAPKKQVGWGGTGEAEWRGHGRMVTFRWTDPEYRETFVKKATELLSPHWSEASRDDDDPASPRRGLA